MANDKTQRVLLEYTVNRNSLNRTLADTRRLAEGNANIRDEIDAMRKSASSLERDLKGTFTGRTVSGAAKLTSEIEQQDDAIRRATLSLDDYNNRFDQISRQQGLAGDVQTNLGAIRGLADAAGAGGLASGVGVAGEIVVLAEELPRLKAAAAGLPSVVGNAVSAIGASGIGLIGAMGALVAVFTLAQAEGRKAAEAARTRLNAEREINELLVTGTRADIEARREQLEVQRQVAQQTLDELNGAIGQADRDLRDLAGVTGEVGVQFLRLGETLGVGEFAQIGELRDTARSTQDEVNNLTRQIEAFDDALETNATTTNDAAEAERQLANERRTATLQFANDEAERIRREFRLTSQSTEALEDRLNAIAEERLALARAQQVLIESGDTSEQVAAQIETYRNQIAALGDEQRFIEDTALMSAQAIEHQASVTEEAAQAAEQAAARIGRLARVQEQYDGELERIANQRNQRLADIEQEYADAQIQIAQEAVDAANDALADLQEQRRELLRDFNRDEADALQEAQRDEIDARIDAQRQERDALTDHLRRLRDIREDAEAADFEAVLNRDFAALFANRRQTSRDLATAGRDFTEEQSDRQRAFDEERADRQEAFRRERADRLEKYAQDLADAQEQYQREIALAREAEQQELLIARQAQQRSIREAQQASNDQLRIAQQRYNEELRIAARGAEESARIEQQRQQALATIAQRALTQLAQASLTASTSSTTVNSVGGITQNISGGANPQQVAQAVRSETINVIRQVFG